MDRKIHASVLVLCIEVDDMELRIYTLHLRCKYKTVHTQAVWHQSTCHTWVMHVGDAAIC